ncbi:MAG: T9SS type A sorting domain-containing protein [Lewinellaceae bacterium]|nr:T9SS type A sorting domain-containing protein [Lewinellaceae bacterium]
MKNKLLLLTLACWAGQAGAQSVQGTYGPSYIIQGFYAFEANTMDNSLNTEWDIAFFTGGAQGAGIHVNEAAGSSGTELELYEAPTSDFNATISTGSLELRLYNDELSWEHGAFNANNDPGDPDDYGWGYYIQSQDAIIGDEVFVLKLRNGAYKKIQIVSLEQGIYTFKYANLDGSAETVKTINRADFGSLAFFTFTGGGEVLDYFPQQWDLLFTRYSAPLDDGSPDPVNYLVTGTLSGYGVEVAKATGVDPQSVNFESYEDSLKSGLDVIGYDWKDFNLQTLQWSLPGDRAYFVKTASGDVWKVIFTSFSGSSSGNFSFNREFVGNVSSSHEAETAFSSGLGVFPNPVQGETTLAFSLRQAGRVQVLMHNSLGQLAWSGRFEANEGFNAIALPELAVPAGLYAISLQFENGDVVTQMAIHQ